jgi:hypothetical protein
MGSRFFTIGTVAVLAAMTASSAVSNLRLTTLMPNVMPGREHLFAVGTRSVLQRQSTAAAKMDSVLADLSRHAARARPDHLLADLHSLSPAARFKTAGASAGAGAMVLVDATARGNPQQMKSALTALGLTHAAVYSNDVGGWLPVNQIETAAARSEVLSLRAAMPRKRAPVALQGDYVQHSAAVRSNFPTLLGTGVTVGVLSDSFNCYAVYAIPSNGVPVSGYAGYAYNGFTADYATDVSTAALPSGVNVVEEADCLNYGAPDQPPFGDEGRAMLQIVHVVAPGASLAFYTAENSEADFASGIGTLAADGAKVIADDVGYFDEPFFQDGIVAQAIDTVEAQGVAYFSAAGNDGNSAPGDVALSYENTAPSFTTQSTTAPTTGEFLLNFDTTGATNTTSLPVSIPPIPPGDFLAIVVQWDQPYVTGAPGSPGASSSIDLCVTGGTGSDTILNYDGDPASCTGPNAVGVDPYQIMIIGNPANAAGPTTQQTLNIEVGLSANGDGTVAPGRVIVAVEDDGLGSKITSFATNSATLQGHPGAAGAAAVGAAFYFDTPSCGTTPAELEFFSSQGGAPILFNTSGVRLTAPLVRQKPDFVGPDGVNDTFLGFTLATGGISATTTIAGCQNNANYPNFFGTSAATPHAAGVAALMLQADPSVTPTQVYTSFHNSALAMSTPSPNFNSGYGFIQADKALVVPTLTLAASTIALTYSTTLTWSAIDATGCTASGNWNGAMAASGSVLLRPTSGGTQTYTLTCSNAFGTTAAASAILTVTSGTAPAAPILSLTATSVPVGKPVTISWSSINANSCTASGSWSGTLATSGAMPITPTAVGVETFTLTCTNLGGTSAATSVTLNATPELVVPVAPTLTLGATSVPASSTTTISWSSSNAASCTSSGSTNAASSGWANGVQAPKGSFTLTPVTTGTYTYTMVCANSAGNSPATTVTLTVTAAQSIGSGGGGLDGFTLLGLAGLLAARQLASRSKTYRRQSPQTH